MVAADVSFDFLGKSGKQKAASQMERPAQGSIQAQTMSLCEQAIPLQIGIAFQDSRDIGDPLEADPIVFQPPVDDQVEDRRCPIGPPENRIAKGVFFGRLPQAIRPKFEVVMRRKCLPMELDGDARAARKKGDFAVALEA